MYFEKLHSKYFINTSEKINVILYDSGKNYLDVYV